MPVETKPCPQCGKRMIKESTGTVLASNPPQYPMMWWCACGHREDAETVRGTTETDRRRARWEAAQGGS